MARFRDKESSRGSVWSQKKMSVGFLITSRYVLANMHNKGVTKEYHKPMVFNEGIFYNGKFVATSRKYDLTLFRLDAEIKKVNPLQIAHEDTLKKRETVYLPTKISTSRLAYRYEKGETPITVENPGVENTIRRGISLDRFYYVDKSRLGEFYRGALQSTIPTQAYMSGSPVVNSKAQLVGLAIRGSSNGTTSTLPSDIFNFVNEYTKEAERHYTEKTGKVK